MFDKVNFVFSGGGETGYAHHARSFWKALEPLLPQKEGDKTCTIVLGCVNDPEFYKDIQGFKIAYNVWESTRYPEDFFNRLLEFDQLWVPSKWQKKCAITQGYPADRVHIVPEGVDGEVFHTVETPKNYPMRFLVFGRWEDRKFTTEIIEAFLEAFPNDETVCLKLSVDNAYPIDEFSSTEERLECYGLKDPRIENIGFLSREDYVRTLQEGDIFVSCSRAEGWNLPLMEALACGTVSICSNYGAQLDFAQSAIQVKILDHEKPERVYGMKDCPGTWAEPSYKDLIEKLKKARNQFPYFKRKTREASEAFRTKWSWENAAKIAYDILDKSSMNISEVSVPKNLSFKYHFVEGAFIEILGNGKDVYNCKFRDSDTGKEIFNINLTPNHWAKVGRINNLYMGPVYFLNWEITVRKDKEVVFHHKFNAKGKRVFVVIDSKSLGDTIAWLPYCEQFRRKHDCKMIVSSWHNYLFEKTHPDIEFIKPGKIVENIYAQYIVGVFHEFMQFRSPRDWRTVPLQRIASDILGLEYEEMRPLIDISNAYSAVVKRPKKYVCISEHSTAACKYWHYPNGWQILVDELNRRGYNVVAISSEPSNLKNVIHAHNNHIDTTMGLLLRCEFFVGLASGLAWLSWAMGIPVVMISGFSAPFVEFHNGVIRIAGKGDCTCCLNDVLIHDRAWDEGCFHNQDFACTKKITASAVIERIPYFADKNILDFTSAPILRNSRRQTSFKKFLTLVNDGFETPNIVEIGTVRRNPNDPELPGDGNSTCIFAWYVKNYKGSLTAVDISKTSIDNCIINLTRYNLLSEKIILRIQDGVQYLKENECFIDALYIDAYDWGPSEQEKKDSIEWHLEAFKQAESRLRVGSIVMFDDIMDSNYTGKGQLAIPYALGTGNFEKVFHEYQVILRKIM